jgi:lipopolysaccharide transport protein LptA
VTTASGRLAVAAAMVLALGGAVAHAQPAGSSGAVRIEGATFAEFDERTGLLTLRGTPVVIRRGALQLRAPSVVYDAGRRVIQASGGVAYADPRVTLEAPRATVWVDEERLLAEDGVRAVQGQGADAVSLRAARLEVTGRGGRAVATGAVDVTTADLTVTTDRLEADQARDELVASGNTRVVRGDIDGRAPRVLVRRGEGTAVLSGGAVVRQGPNEARAETITVDLRRRRFTAAGQAILVLQPSR